MKFLFQACLAISKFVKIGMTLMDNPTTRVDIMRSSNHVKTF